MLFRWFDTLAGRLTFFVILALVLAQVIGVLTFVRGAQRDESERKGEEFVRALGGMTQLFNAPLGLDRPAYMGTVVQPGFLIWLNVAPAVAQEGVHIASDGPQVPVQWLTIRSP